MPQPTLKLTPQEMVREFHKKFGVDIDAPFSIELRSLRSTLIEEEEYEVWKELNYDNPDVNLPLDKKALTKELADLLYVVYGTAVTFGLPLEEVFEEVHYSNMSKLGEDGQPVRRADGKILKGPNYKEPNLDKYFTV